VNQPIQRWLVASPAQGANNNAINSAESTAMYESWRYIMRQHVAGIVTNKMQKPT